MKSSFFRVKGGDEGGAWTPQILLVRPYSLSKLIKGGGARLSMKNAILYCFIFLFSVRIHEEVRKGKTPSSLKIRKQNVENNKNGFSGKKHFS